MSVAYTMPRRHLKFCGCKRWIPRSAGISCGVARDHAAPCGQDKLQGWVLSGSSLARVPCFVYEGSASRCEGYQDAGVDGVEGAAGRDPLACIQGAQLLSCMSMIQVI